MSPTPTPGARRWLPWIVMAVVVVGALAVGSLGGDPPTRAERAQSIAEGIRCPQCSSQSVANSETPSSKGVKVLIEDRLDAGNTDEEIRDYIASRYGRDVLLDPSGQGFGALVWGLPVVVVVIAVGALVLRFGDWRTEPGAVSQADRDLVADAIAGGPAAGRERSSSVAAGARTEDDPA